MNNPFRRGPTPLEMNFGPQDRFVLIKLPNASGGNAEVIMNPPMSAPELAQLFLSALSAQVQAMAAQVRIWTPGGGQIGDKCPPSNNNQNGSSGGN